MSIAEKLTTIAGNEQKVYQAGQQSEYDKFWDNYQDYGARTIYSRAFAGEGWTKETFKPKYNMQPSVSVDMFRNSAMTGDMVELLENLGITLDLSQSTNVSGMYYLSKFTHLGVLNISNAPNTTGFLCGCRDLETIDEIIFPSSETVTHQYFAQNASALKNLTVGGGVIGRDIDFSYSPLTPESMKSVILHLKDYSGTDEEFDYTVRFSEDCWTALEADSTSPSGGTWAEYVQGLGWLY